MHSANNAHFLHAVLTTLTDAGLGVWIFGGWAEELWELIPPRPHNDIDLLFPAEDFEAIDRFIAERQVMEIVAKRFSHKRAIEIEGVLVEFFLVQQDDEGYFTDFFEGRAVHRWPDDTFSFKRRLHGSNVDVASRQALASYRENHTRIHGTGLPQGP